MDSPTAQFILEKPIWTEADFETMGWHDATVYGFSFVKDQNSWTGDLLLDIDYIFKWVKSELSETAFKFWVAPCTLVFKEVFKLRMNIDTENYSLDGLEISDINLRGKTEEKDAVIFHWDIELQQGKIELDSSGFIQIVRQKPSLLDKQVLGKAQRGGTSFDLTSCYAL